MREISPYLLLLDGNCLHGEVLVIFTHDREKFPSLKLCLGRQRLEKTHEAKAKVMGGGGHSLALDQFLSETKDDLYLIEHYRSMQTLALGITLIICPGRAVPMVKEMVAPDWLARRKI